LLIGFWFFWPCSYLLVWSAVSKHGKQHFVSVGIWRPVVLPVKELPGLEVLFIQFYSFVKKETLVCTS
jgi:hypothetical protein